MDETTQGASLGAALDGIFTAEPAEDPTAEQTPTGDTTSGNQEDGQEIQQAEGQEVDTPEIEDDFTDEEAEQTPTDATGRRIVDKNRFNMILGSHRAMRDMKAALGGELPSVEEIQTAQNVHADVQSMAADMESGDPQRVSGFVDYWTQHNPQSLPAFVERGIVRMRDTAPEQYQELQGAFNSNLMDSLYAKAGELRASNSAEFKDFMFATQVLNWYLTGDYKEVEDVKVTDPLDERLGRLQEYEQRIAANQANEARLNTQRFQSSVNSTLTNASREAIANALKPVAEAYKDKPTMMEGLQTTLLNRAKAAVQADKNWLAQFNRAKEHAGRTRTRQDVERVVGMFKQRFDRAIAAHRSAVIKEANSRELASNKSAHANGAASEARREPGTGGGSPRPITGTQAVQDAFKSGSVKAVLDAMF